MTRLCSTLLVGLLMAMLLSASAPTLRSAKGPLMHASAGFITESTRYRMLTPEEIRKREIDEIDRGVLHTHKARPEDFYSTISEYPVFAYLPYYRLPQRGFPYHYYFENGVTHLIFYGLTIDEETLTMRGQRLEDRQLPAPAEWVQLRALARQYKAKLLLSFGGPGQRSAGLTSVIHLYFYNVDSDKPRRAKRNQLIKDIAKFYVEWDFDGLDVDWKIDAADKANDNAHFWIGIRNFLRDVKEEVMILRAKRTMKPHFGLKHFFTSLTMAPTPDNMAVAQLGNLSAYIDVIHWMLYDDAPERSFLQHTRGESNKEKERHEIGHGPQHDSYFHHASLNYTIWMAMRIAESRVAARRGEDMAKWSRQQRIRLEDEVILDDLPEYHVDMKEYNRLKDAVAAELTPFPTTFPVSPEQEETDKRKRYYYEKKGDCMHTIGIPFYGVDIRRGPLMYSTIMKEVRERMKAEGREGWQEYDPDDKKLLAKNPHLRDWEKIYILDGMGFDNVEVIRQKMRIASQLGFGGVMIWEIGQDEYPKNYQHLTIPPLPAPPPEEKKHYNELTDDERIILEAKEKKSPGGLDLSVSLPMEYNFETLPKAPKAPARSLLRAIHEEVELWNSEAELNKEKKDRIKNQDPDVHYLHPPSQYIPRLHKSSRKPPRQEPPKEHEVMERKKNEFGDYVLADPEVTAQYRDDL
eukprot:gene6995-4959_t